MAPVLADQVLLLPRPVAGPSPVTSAQVQPPAGATDGDHVPSDVPMAAVMRYRCQLPSWATKGMVVTLVAIVATACVAALWPYNQAAPLGATLCPRLQDHVAFNNSTCAGFTARAERYGGCQDALADPHRRQRLFPFLDTWAAVEASGWASYLRTVYGPNTSLPINLSQVTMFYIDRTGHLPRSLADEIG